jgi:hypothetical protein
VATSASKSFSVSTPSPRPVKFGTSKLSEAEKEAQLGRPARPRDELGGLQDSHGAFVPMNTLPAPKKGRATRRPPDCAGHQGGSWM